jgi:2-oxoisovalerate dehydrogenase E1 component alpha subunit
MPHTTDDDDRRYRPAEEVEQARLRDPVVTLAQQLVEQGDLTEEQVEQIKAGALDAVNEATDFADAAIPPDSSTLHDNVYAP